MESPKLVSIAGEGDWTMTEGVLLLRSMVFTAANDGASPLATALRRMCKSLEF